MLGIRPWLVFDEFDLEGQKQAFRIANSAYCVRKWIITNDFWKQPHVRRSLAYIVAEGKPFSHEMDDFDPTNPEYQEIAVQMFMDFHLEQSLNENEADIDGTKVKEESEDTAYAQMKREQIATIRHPTAKTESPSHLERSANGTLTDPLLPTRTASRWSNKPHNFPSISTKESEK